MRTITLLLALTLSTGAPRTQGVITKLGEVDGGTIPVAATVKAGLVYDSIAQQVLVSDGGAWSTVGIASSGPAATYLMATFSASQTTNIGVNDHYKFNVVTSSAGSLITLDTSTTYTNTNNVASLGRFTLKANHAYFLSAADPEVQFNNPNSSLVAGWVNADTGAILNPIGVALSFGGGGSPDNNWSFNPESLFVPGSDTRVEIRIVVAPAALVSIGGSSSVISADGGLVTTFPRAVIFALN